jgi:predicted TIM-barrel fold metal-dependent hydrolase
LPKYYAQKIIDTHGANKIIFGTDSPWHTAEMEMKLLNTLEISHADWEKITHKNAEKLLGI